MHDAAINVFSRTQECDLSQDGSVRHGSDERKRPILIFSMSQAKFVCIVRPHATKITLNAPCRFTPPVSPTPSSEKATSLVRNRIELWCGHVGQRTPNMLKIYKRQSQLFSLSSERKTVRDLVKLGYATIPS